MKKAVQMRGSDNRVTSQAKVVSPPLVHHDEREIGLGLGHGFPFRFSQFRRPFG